MTMRPYPDQLTEPGMVRIPEGWFVMGDEAGRDDERPAHRVWVEAFELAATQVTNAEYAKFLRRGVWPEFTPTALVGAPTEDPARDAKREARGQVGGPDRVGAGSKPPLQWDDPEFNHPEQPVVAVSWYDAAAYCAWLSRRTGSFGAASLDSARDRQDKRRYRLPTEAEWERAARGGVEGAAYPWGDAPPESLPDYASRWKTGPERVGLYAPNAYGLHNLCDNVHEWCADWYDAGYYAHSPGRNPQGPADGMRRASRGGSWRHQIKVSRCAARSSIPPEFKYADYGFRVARDLAL